MPTKYNQKLYAIMSASALMESTTPIIVCDKDFRVCMVSPSTRQTFKPITVGRDISSLFSEQSIEQIRTLSTPSVFEMVRADKIYNVIVHSDTLDGEQYFMIIIEGQLMLFGDSTKQYITDGFLAVQSAARELLSGKKTSPKHLEWASAMLARLSEFTQRRAGRTLSLTNSEDIYAELDILINESTSPLRKIGASIIYEKELTTPFMTTVTPRHVYLCVSTLTAALSIISSNGVIRIGCRHSRSRSIIGADFLDISFSLDTDSRLEMIDSFDSLISCVRHMSLELAAVSDMARSAGAYLDCETEGDSLTVHMRIPFDKSGTVKFRVMELICADTVRSRMQSLCEYVAFCKE